MDPYITNRPYFRAESFSQIEEIREFVASDDGLFDLRRIAPAPPALDAIRERMFPRWDWRYELELSGQELQRELDQDVDGAEAARWEEWSYSNWGTPYLACDAVIRGISKASPQITYWFTTPAGPPRGIYTALRHRFPSVDIRWFYSDPRRDGWQLMTKASGGIETRAQAKRELDRLWAPAEQKRRALH